MRDTAQFECGCWLHEVGCVRHPPITGTMCCPIHRKPYPLIEVHFAMLDAAETETLAASSLAGSSADRKETGE